MFQYQCHTSNKHNLKSTMNFLCRQQCVIIVDKTNGSEPPLELNDCYVYVDRPTLGVEFDIVLEMGPNVQAMNDPATFAASKGYSNGPMGFGRYAPAMRKVVPDRSVNSAPVFPALKYHLPSGPDTTACRL